MTVSLYPAPYVPKTVPSISGADATYLRRELLAVSTTLTQILNLLGQPATAAPPQPQTGMVRLSQSPWRPISGQTTDLWVIYGPAGWTAL